MTTAHVSSKEITPVTKNSEYSYTSANSASSAANKYFDEVINVDNKYKITDISTKANSINICNYISKAGWLNWWNPPFSHTDPDTNAERNRNLTITSLEIRLEQVPL